MVDRSATHSVTVERVRLGLVVRTVITFFGTYGMSLAPSFVPWRSGRVRAELVEKQWPVKDILLGPLGRRPEEGPVVKW